ncbi:MAG: DUF3048 domain-containing protein [Anaerolineales bacterium]|jgi:hypothetical protein
MKHTWILIPTLLIVIILLASSPVRAAESAPAISQTETPQPTDPDEYEETVPPPEAANSTNTPTPTFVPPPTQTPIPRVPGTGLPVVVPLLDSGLPNDGYGPDWYPSYINPLTGLVVPDPHMLEQRPVAIKVTNYPRYVRPQSGLSQAAIVYEYYMEHGIPRFIAVYYGQEGEKVGPVRSGRLFDEHIFRMYDSYFVFGYADERVLDYFQSLETEIVDRFVLENDLDHRRSCGGSIPVRLCRDPELDGYNTMFANTEAIRVFNARVHDNNDKPDLSGMYFTDHVPPSIHPARRVKVRFSPSIYHYWDYDETSGLYLRWQETKGNIDFSIESYLPHYDALTEERLRAANVVVLVVDHKFYTYSDRSEIMGINLNGSGRAMVFRDGFYYPAVWVRPKAGGVLRLYSPEGEPFPFKPGQTWFQVLSQYTEFDHDGDEWGFIFQLPPAENGPINLLDAGLRPLDWFYLDQNPGKPVPWNGVIEDQSNGS